MTNLHKGVNHAYRYGSSIAVWLRVRAVIGERQSPLQVLQVTVECPLHHQWQSARAPPHLPSPPRPLSSAIVGVLTRPPTHRHHSSLILHSFSLGVSATAHATLTSACCVQISLTANNMHVCHNDLSMASAVTARGIYTHTTHTGYSFFLIALG